MADVLTPEDVRLFRSRPESGHLVMPADALRMAESHEALRAIVESLARCDPHPTIDDAWCYFCACPVGGSMPLRHDDNRACLLNKARALVGEAAL